MIRVWISPDGDQTVLAKDGSPPKAPGYVYLVKAPNSHQAHVALVLALTAQNLLQDEDLQETDPEAWGRLKAATKLVELEAAWDWAAEAPGKPEPCGQCGGTGKKAPGSPAPRLEVVSG